MEVWCTAVVTEVAAAATVRSSIRSMTIFASFVTSFGWLNVCDCESVDVNRCVGDKNQIVCFSIDDMKRPNVLFSWERNDSVLGSRLGLNMT
jgi:hypothetical protein